MSNTIEKHKFYCYNRTYSDILLILSSTTPNESLKYICFTKSYDD